MEYSIVPLSQENIKDLTYLYKKVFGNSVTLNSVNRKFDTSYLGKSLFGHLAYDKDQPIAFHGAIPVLMEYENTYEIAAQYGDAMTLPNYTGKGLFTTLGNHTDEQLKSAGIRFVWGFPNQNSEYGYLNKLNWIYKERMQGFKVKAANIPLEKLVKKNNTTNSLYNKRIERVFEKYKIDVSVKGSVFNNTHIVSTARNSAYYQYKSFTNNFTIELNNVIFWIKIKNGLLIGDVEASNEIDFDKALYQLKSIAAKNGISELIFQASPDTQISSLMANRADEQFESWVVGFKNFSSDFPLEKLKFTFGDLDTF
ncbi:GNAT family N-acetyltransferase [Aquimarina sp. 2201CG14-23]|uniref:GNAT family N-acetyltransferase n=1 Tax=Aquimarina mycalae TaxID=3040073 RepID=UPI002478262B|nr:GNAT family N-acetyltransferase [Aquimarina sp. 2201CG14-23]MDH7448049.1 GNAT family N-acetyltransferase [Aquimarina sp. 2201CG14-23]